MSDIHRPKKIHKTLVWGGWYGSRNIGDTAILLGIKELYKIINSDRHYYLGFLSTDVEYTNTNGVSGKRALLKSDLVKPWNWIKLFNIFRESDRVIISGGTPIFDFSHAIRTVYFFLPLLLKKPFIFFGIGVKPIKNWYGKIYVPFVLNRAGYLSTRDESSTKILKGLGINKITETADSAFFAPASSNDDLEKILKRYDIKLKDKLLVVTPRLMSPDKKRLYLDEDMSKEVIKQTPKKIAKAIDMVSGKFDKVVFIAMHYYGPDSDVELIKQIMSFSKSKNTVFIDEELRAEVAISLFKQAHLVLGMRLHSLLLSASMSTPMVGISYEQKVTDLFLRLKLNEYVVDLFNFTDSQLHDLLKNAEANHSKLQKHLSNRVKKLRELVMSEAQNVLKIDKNYAYNKKS
jgi:polysaccharide pyruvyl transferase WcaK-like protein